jgi:thiosulfate dehydrogenase [quinone] large subunit
MTLNCLYGVIILDMKIQKYAFVTLRLSMSFIFLWAFFDKLFGLGFATKSVNAWINGGSPTSGFLKFAVKGPYADFFNSLAGQVWVDWVFMAGLLFVGLTLFFNKYLKWGAIAGSIMMILMYLALLLPENNPIIDDHIIYILVLIILATKGRGID